MCHHATECAPILCVPCVGSSAYTGPYSGAGGGPTDNVMTFTRFKRSGNTLRQWYKIDSDMSATYPRTDSEWTPVSDYGGASISISPSDNVVILLGEAGSPAGGPGIYQLFHYSMYESPPPPPATPCSGFTFWTQNGGGSGTDTWAPGGGYSCAVVDHVFTSDFDVVIAVHGHSYIGMGMGYGSGVSADTNLHVGHTGGNCYGSNIGQWTSSFGLTYTGGYHCARALCRTCAEPCLCAHVPSRD